MRLEAYEEEIFLLCYLNILVGEFEKPLTPVHECSHIWQRILRGEARERGNYSNSYLEFH